MAYVLPDFNFRTLESIKFVCAASVVASPLVIQLTGGKEEPKGVADIIALLNFSTHPQLASQTTASRGTRVRQNLHSGLQQSLCRPCSPGVPPSITTSRSARSVLDPRPCLLVSVSAGLSGDLARNFALGSLWLCCCLAANDAAPS